MKYLFQKEQAGSMECFVQAYSVSPYDVIHVGSNFATKCCFIFSVARALMNYSC